RRGRAWSRRAAGGASTPEGVRRRPSGCSPRLARFDEVGLGKGVLAEGPLDAGDDVAVLVGDLGVVREHGATGTHEAGRLGALRLALLLHLGATLHESVSVAGRADDAVHD